MPSHILPCKIEFKQWGFRTTLKSHFFALDNTKRSWKVILISNNPKKRMPKESYALFTTRGHCYSKMKKMFKTDVARCWDMLFERRYIANKYVNKQPGQWTHQDQGASFHQSIWKEFNRCDLTRLQNTTAVIRPEGRVTSWQETCSSSKEGVETGGIWGGRESRWSKVPLMPLCSTVLRLLSSKHHSDSIS